MSMVQVVPSAAVGAGIVDNTLKSLGFRADPAIAPSQGVRLEASDYLSFSGTFLAGVTVGAVSVYEMGKIARDLLGR